ncbi:MAG: class I SAM-dependent methyltransferase [Candidatus Hydrogenedentes bacterium]|nr:class I SAM-dependent methyltransferase [Candidatus Hydrogenedentota bacterium]
MSAFQMAQFYELLENRGGRLEREGNLLLEALDRAPSRQAADLACGLGIHAAFLAKHDADVFAADLSIEMIRHAREKRPHPRITYETGDMRETGDGPYGMVICLGNSLSLLQSVEDLRLFFTNVHRILAPGGLLITQTLNYDADTMKHPRIRMEQQVLDTGAIAAVKRFLPGETSTLLSITYYAATTEIFMDTTETVHLQHWSKKVLSETAEDSGLEVEAVYGGFDGVPIHSNSPDIILLAQKC